MKIMGFILGITTFCSFVASLAWADPDSYKSGQRLYTEWHGHFENLGETHGQFLLVPIDYENLGRGKTPIYYHFSEPYNPELPTLLEFNGGPGASSHEPKVFKGFNVLNVDGRGIAFSRPEKFEIYSDKSIYSSENSARDAAEVLKRLKIKNVTVLGASYGSVPASIFAERYANKTRALILINPTSHQVKAEVGLEHLRQFTQNLIDSLSEDTLAFLNSIAKDGDSYSHDELVIFSKIALDLWHGEALYRLRDLLNRATMSRYEMAFNAVTQSELSLWFHEMQKMQDPMVFDLFVKDAIEEREEPIERRLFEVRVINNRAVIVKRDGVSATNRKPVKTFGAREFKVPLFVLAGSEDVRTPIANTEIEFQLTKAPIKQMIRFEGRGHNLLNLKRWSELGQTPQEKGIVNLLVQSLFQGLVATSDKLTELNALGPMKLNKVQPRPLTVEDCESILK